MKLDEILERVPNSIMAAWIDSRSGATMDKQALGNRASSSAGLEAVTEIVCSPDRPRRMVLMSDGEVYIAQRPTDDSHHVLVVVCTRSPNVAMSVVLVGVCASESAKQLGAGA
jgi:hypothetical protein